MNFDKHEVNFREFIDTLPENVRQAAWEHLVLKLLGKPTPPIIIPIARTFDENMPISELLNTFEQSFKINPTQNTFTEFESLLKQTLDGKLAIEKIIGHLLDNTEDAKKADEIISLGKFLHTTGLEYTVELSERPDFVLKNSNSTIGVEHTRLESEPDKELHSELFSKYVVGAIEIIKQRQPNLTGIIDLTLDADVKLIDGKGLKNLKSKSIRKYRQDIHLQLADCMMSIIAKNKATLPKFVKRCNYSPSSKNLDVKLQDEYIERTDFVEILKDKVARKEVKLNDYKELYPQISYWWLLIVYGGTKYSTSFRIDKLDEPINHSFDRVVILNSFNLSCYELSQTSPFLIKIDKRGSKAIHIPRCL